MSNQIGQVVKCAHCGGRGSCACDTCAPVGYRPRPCTSCKGAGSVWVGPSVVHFKPTDKNG